MRLNRIVPLLPVAALVVACSTMAACSTQSSSDKEAADTSGNSTPAFAHGYTALKDGDYSNAQRNFEVAYQKRPDDPYEEMDLGAAYQNEGLIDKALPLYMQAETNGHGVVPAYTTKDSDNGKTIPQIVQTNLALAGLDANGNPLHPTPVAATAPAPVPVPAPAPVAAESQKEVFQVFFDFDKSEITPQAAQILQQAAVHAQSGGQVRIVATGHTDTVGTEAYNMKLSERRAQAVKDALVAAGIPADEITTRGVGKQELLIPTADGVREPQNRRVEIVEAPYQGS